MERTGKGSNRREVNRSKERKTVKEYGSKDKGLGNGSIKTRKQGNAKGERRMPNTQ